MADVVITHTGALGRQQHVVNSSDVSEIVLRNRSIKRIDLSELSRCNLLRRLDLSGNEIESIKLDSLSQCRVLKNINLSQNKLKEIDLYPLQSNRGLDLIDLSHNPLRHLDLTPVFSGPDIRIDKTCKIQLSLLYRYLMKLGDLSVIELVDSKGSIENSPRIHWASIRDLAAKTDFASIVSSIQSVIANKKPLQQFRLMRGLMSAFGFDELGGYDGPIQDLLIGIEPDEQLETTYNRLLDNAIRLLKTQIQNGGSTLFLDLNEIKKSRASLLAMNIVERRKRELEEACVLDTDKGYDLSALCLTYYGYQIISTIQLGILTDDQGIIELENRLLDAGFELHYASDWNALAKFKAKYSSSLREYVYDRIQL